MRRDEEGEKGGCEKARREEAGGEQDPAMKQEEGRR
jgi:hypothetical protein